MKEQELLSLGFKKKSDGDNYWFELKKGKHRFVSSDTFFNKKEFCLAYEDLDLQELVWFNNGLKSFGDFIVVYKILTGKRLFS